MGDKDGRKNDVFHPRRKIVTNIVLLIFIFLIPIFFNFLLSCPLVSDSISRKVSIVSPLAEQKPFVLSQYRNILNFIIFNSFSESEILIFQVVVFVQKSSFLWISMLSLTVSEWWCLPQMSPIIYRWMPLLWENSLCHCQPVELPSTHARLDKNPLSKLKRDWQTVIYWTFENLNSEI